MKPVLTSEFQHRAMDPLVQAGTIDSPKQLLPLTKAEQPWTTGANAGLVQVRALSLGVKWPIQIELDGRDRDSAADVRQGRCRGQCIVEVVRQQRGMWPKAR